MHVNRHRWILGVTAVFLCVTASVLVARAAGDQRGAFKLEGAWVATVVEGPLAQWDYTLSPDASGRRASINGAVVVHFPGTPTDADLVPVALIGEAILTGPDTFEAEVLFHRVHYNQIVAVGRAHAVGRVLGPGKLETTSQFNFYLPGDDGMPAGEPLPGMSFTTVSVDSRVPSPGL